MLVFLCIDVDDGRNRSQIDRMIRRSWPAMLGHNPALLAAKSYAGLMLKRWSVQQESHRLSLGGHRHERFLSVCFMVPETCGRAVRPVGGHEYETAAAA